MKPVRVTFITPLAWIGAYHRRLLHGLAGYARAHQWSLTVVNPDTAKQLMALDRHADGLILTPHPLLEGYRRPFRCPVVSLSGEDDAAPWPCIKADDHAMGRLAAEHLIDRGFRRLAFVGDFTGRSWVRQRHEGFTSAAEERGIACLEFGMSVRVTPPGRSALRTAAHREGAIARWLRQLPQPLGVMGCNDYWGARTIRACRAVGLKVPEDVAVIGVDDDDLHVETCDPPLSSIPHRYDRMAQEAGDLLARLMAGARAPEQPISIPPGELVVRQSSDTAANHDPLVTAAAHFIRRRLATGVSVKEVLAEVAVSRSLLDARFRQVLGRSVAEEIRRARMERAKQLLAASDLPMPAVAQQAGFSSAFQFSKGFRRAANMTPTEYRRRFRITTPGVTR